MYKFILGLIAGAALCHFAEDRKKKKAVDDIKAAGAAVGARHLGGPLGERCEQPTHGLRRDARALPALQRMAGQPLDLDRAGRKPHAQHGMGQRPHQKDHRAPAGTERIRTDFGMAHLRDMGVTDFAAFSRKAPCASTPPRLNPRHHPSAERCRSGRTGRSRKPLSLHGFRGFESHPLRHFHVILALLPSCGLFAQGEGLLHHRLHGHIA